MRLRNLLGFGLVIALGLTLAACQDQQTGSDEEAAADTERSESVESNEGGGTAEDESMATQGNNERMNLQQAIEAAKRDLAEQSGADPQAISVVEARAVTWPNGALGCPEEGMMYTQALVDGFYIRLDDGQAEHAYHAGRDGEPFSCPPERSQKPDSEAKDRARS